MTQQEITKLKGVVRNIPDFPVAGVQFKDLTTLFKDAECLQLMEQGLVELFRDKGVTKVLGIESRGFIGGSLLAARLGAGFVPIRKPGKLPAETVSKSYSKEYGTDTIEIHKDAITTEDVVVIHDDLLATGGTMLAAYELVKSMNPRAIYINFVCELSFLEGRKVLPKDVEVTSLFDF
ncbi:MAG: adenine phosphoribosyltransferase [Muribaculaceae bacterium]|nr:adenine phosphoribosyltransferase [Muribaculaceae bacterium]MBQ9219366.1 adenine phosphoribosyltransferase [Muribaculaceae bacterium]MBR1474658.1 adenine phosphoribosyltransferase [Muribaculaceae bacterium]MBR1726286.1 adenine phosphoribosyltransferase [Muribaculaceae bacterium]